jgi:hypothetical protein
LIYLFDRALAFTSHDFVTRGDRKVNAQVHPHRSCLSDPTQRSSRQLVQLLTSLSPTASYYSPIAIAAARTLLTKIQIINTAASTMEQFAVV